MQKTVDDRLIAKLQEVSDRYDQLNEELLIPAIASNPIKSIAKRKELGRLRRLVEPFKEFSKVRAELADARAIVGDKAQDAELRELAEAEIDALQAKDAFLLESLKALIVTDEDSAINSVILEIRAGTGGEEAALFVRDLCGMYMRFCETKGLSAEILAQSSADKGGLKEVILKLKGSDVFRLVGYEGGVHRVQRKPHACDLHRLERPVRPVLVPADRLARPRRLGDVVRGEQRDVRTEDWLHTVEQPRVADEPQPKRVVFDQERVQPLGRNVRVLFDQPLHVRPRFFDQVFVDHPADDRVPVLFVLRSDLACGDLC